MDTPSDHAGDSEVSATTENSTADDTTHSDVCNTSYNTPDAESSPSTKGPCQQHLYNVPPASATIVY